MKKYILPLILILFLTFILIGNCADLFGTYDQRIKLTIDNTKIDSALAWFPVTIFLTNSQGEEVFAEFDADADYLKVAFTKSDGTTELYAECELFDDSAEKAIYHVSRDGWAISDSADTDFYMYYDNDAGDNNTYIGAITARTEVWDGNFELVCHMVDDNGNTDDSTSNSVDLTKASAGNPAEATGKVGQGQDFTGSGDYLTHATFLDVMPDDLTVEAIIKLDTTTAYNIVFHKHNISAQDRIGLQVKDDNTVVFWGEAENAGSKSVTSTNTVSDATWHYIAGVHTHGAALKVYLDVAEDTGDTLGTVQDGTFADIIIGEENILGAVPFDGILDELRFSSTPRTAAWLKGTKNTLWDALLTYGSEEEAPAVGITWNTVTITKWNTKTITTPINTQ